MSDEIQYQIALTMAGQVGPVTARTLVSYCGSASEVFRTSRSQLLKIPGIGPVVAQALHDDSLLKQAEEEINQLEEHGIQALFYTHPDFPVRLRQTADSPALIYAKSSDIRMLNAERIVGIVGTRQPTAYGQAVCEELVDGLQAMEAVLVSGLAFGIDICAHRKAVSNHLPNIAVLGHGLSSIYPSSHRQVALRIAENGCLLTEYPFRTPPDREHFPMRNRIIAGLCDALAVVETAQTGGSMITAQLADQYGREIFAFPGRISDPKSIGCHLLIKQNLARLATGAEDIAQAMLWDDKSAPTVIQRKLFEELDERETLVVHIVREFPEIPIDQLTERAAMSPGQLAGILLQLECKGILRTLPGKRYLITG